MYEPQELPQLSRDETFRAVSYTRRGVAHTRIRDSAKLGQSCRSVHAHRVREEKRNELSCFCVHHEAELSWIAFRCRNEKGRD